MIKSARGAKAKADTLASLITRSAGECMKCGVSCECPNFPSSHTTGCPLTCSHIIKRRYSGTRCDLRNLQCLCYSCHYWFENWPREFSKWVTDTIGSELYGELRLKAQEVNKIDWAGEVIQLKAVFAGICDD